MSENEKVLEAISDFALGLEAIAVKLKRDIAEIATAPSEKQVSAVLEETFTSLTFEEHTGDKLAQYGTATEKNNLPDKFLSARNILRQSNATISHRYHGENYLYTYWIYDDRIFRQKLRK